MQKEPTKKAAGKRNAGANPPRKLSRAEKKQIAEVIRQAKGDGKAHTAQQTIPYLTMYPDGICKVSEKKYSKSIAFEDINYQLAQADDKTAIFERRTMSLSIPQSLRRGLPLKIFIPVSISTTPKTLALPIKQNLAGFWVTHRPLGDLCFCAVTGFGFHSFRQDVLQTEQAV